MAGKGPPSEGRGLPPGDIPPWWPLGKASSHVGASYYTVWPPKCTVIARVPFCLCWKDSSEATHAFECFGKDICFTPPSKLHHELFPALRNDLDACSEMVRANIPLIATHPGALAESSHSSLTL